MVYFKMFSKITKIGYAAKFIIGNKILGNLHLKVGWVPLWKLSAYLQESYSSHYFPPQRSAPQILAHQLILMAEADPP